MISDKDDLNHYRSLFSRDKVDNFDLNEMNDKHFPKFNFSQPSSTTVVDCVNFDYIIGLNKVTQYFWNSHDTDDYVNMIDYYNSSAKYIKELKDCGYDKYLLSEMEEELKNLSMNIDLTIQKFVKEINVFIIESFLRYEESIIEDLSMIDNVQVYQWNKYMTELYENFPDFAIVDYTTTKNMLDKIRKIED